MDPAESQRSKCELPAARAYQDVPEGPHRRGKGLLRRFSYQGDEGDVGSYSSDIASLMVWGYGRQEEFDQVAVILDPGRPGGVPRIASV